MDKSLTSSKITINYSDDELSVFAEKTGKTPEEFNNEILPSIKQMLEVMRYRLRDCTVSIADNVCWFGYASAHEHFRADLVSILNEQSCEVKKQGWEIVSWFRRLP